MKFILSAVFAFSSLALAMPSQPTHPEHPSSPDPLYEVTRADRTVSGRSVEVFLPVTDQPVPVVVFGHGQAIDVTGYDQTFEHLASKGIAVIHPKYDNGFFDRNWTRMASDYNSLTARTISDLGDAINPNQIIYSGHSKGAYVALMAAGDRPEMAPAALVLFAPADYNSSYLQRLNPETPLTIIWGESDSIIGKNVMTSIYNQAPSLKKQFIEVVSYPSRSADHYFVQNKRFIFGGHDGTSAYHYFGVWKWLIGAAWDIQKSGSSVSNPYIYGEDAHQTGVEGLNHRIDRSW